MFVHFGKFGVFFGRCFLFFLPKRAPISLCGIFCPDPPGGEVSTALAGPGGTSKLQRRRLRQRLESRKLKPLTGAGAVESLEKLTHLFSELPSPFEVR